MYLNIANPTGDYSSILGYSSFNKQADISGIPGLNGVGTTPLNTGAIPGTSGTPEFQFQPGQGMPGAGSFNFGANLPTAQLALGGIQGAANLFGALNAQRLARDQFNFTRDVTNTNLNNSISSYNTALGDRARARGVAEGQSQSDIDDYISRNRLSR